MKTISRRELRNQSGEFFRALERGESFLLTNLGVPVGRITPAGSSALEDLTLRRGSQQMSFPPGVQLVETVADALDELRGQC